MMHFNPDKCDWLIDLLFYVPLKNISLKWRRHHCQWRAAKFRPVLGAQCLWVGMDLYRATLAVTRGLGFSGLIRRTAPISSLLRHTRGCGGHILTRIRITTKRKQTITPYYIHGKELTITTKAKYLGVSISNNLCWNHHIDGICKKASNTTASLRRNLSHCPTTTKEKCYKTLVRPQVENAS
jgi:hypothetical protein